jgi:hypothetical protein
MSYCRWSSDNYACDVYVYENIYGGWTTHIAKYRRKHSYPCPSLDFTDVNTLQESLQLQQAWLDESVLELIDSPNAGKSFNDPTPEACAARLENLREEGLAVPQYAIDTLMEEENGS